MLLKKRSGKNNYPQVFLEERKYVSKEKKIPKYINNIEISSDSDRESSGGENSDEQNFDKQKIDQENKKYIII